MSGLPESSTNLREDADGNEAQQRTIQETDEQTQNLAGSIGDMIEVFRERGSNLKLLEARAQALGRQGEEFELLVFVVATIVITIRVCSLNSHQKQVDARVFQLMDDVLRSGIPRELLMEFHEVSRAAFAARPVAKQLIKRGRVAGKK
ncbi:hypothetical protein M3Y99_00810200 [Aphelenchoides fujianensis]|nr:hypothetical protein M3Y99_00810200 [Aphelenchoides fujianensis]